MILADISNKLTNSELGFNAFGRKTQIAGKIWENFENFGTKLNRKNDFLILYLEKLFLNIERWKITPDFSNIFSDFGGRGNVPSSPLPCAYAYVNRALLDIQ